MNISNCYLDDGFFSWGNESTVRHNILFIPWLVVCAGKVAVYISRYLCAASSVSDFLGFGTISMRPCAYQSCPRSVASVSHPARAEWCWKIEANTELGCRVGKKRAGRGEFVVVEFFCQFYFSSHGILYSSRVGSIDGKWLFFTVYLRQSWPRWLRRWLTQRTEAFLSLKNWDFFLVS